MPYRTPLYPGVLFSALCLLLAALLAGRPVPAPAPAPVAAAACTQPLAAAVAGDRVWQLSHGGIYPPVGSKSGCAGVARLWVADWDGAAVGRPVVPFGGEARRIEDLFLELHGQLWVDGVGYRVSDGVFKYLQGARAWVAVRPRPPAASSAGLQVVLFELNGRIYYGGLQKAT